jgi:phosphatidylglycerol:prolipoprotein diacylglycerol transferase
MINNINFPGLGLSFTINRVAFSIGIRDVYWYGVIIGFGLLLAVLFAAREGRRMGLPKDTMTDVALFATPVAILFARLYFVIFNWRAYAGTPLSVFNIREGGLAVYGGVIGGVLTACAYCKIKKISVAKVFDAGAFGLLIGQSVGRWGNFVNAEAYGSETSLPWRMELFSAELNQMVAVHPTFLYESLWNAVGFAGLLLYRKHKKFEGEVFLLYTTWYGIGRAWIEHLRVDSLPYGADFKISQIVAVTAAILGTALIAYHRKTARKM